MKIMMKMKIKHFCIFFILFFILLGNQTVSNIDKFKITDFTDNGFQLLVDEELNFYIFSYDTDNRLIISKYNKNKKLVNSSSTEFVVEDISKDFEYNYARIYLNILQNNKNLILYNGRYIYQLDKTNFKINNIYRLGKNHKILEKQDFKKVESDYGLNIFLDIYLEQELYLNKIIKNEFLYIHSLYYLEGNNPEDSANSRYYTDVYYKNKFQSSQYTENDDYSDFFVNNPKINYNNEIISGFDYKIVNKELNKYGYKILDKAIEFHRSYLRTLCQTDNNGNIYYLLDITSINNNSYNNYYYSYDNKYITDSRSAIAIFKRLSNGSYKFDKLIGPHNTPELDNWRIYFDDIYFIKDGKAYVTLRRNIFEPKIDGNKKDRLYKREIWAITID